MKKRIAEISETLPEGVYINTVLERSEFIGKTMFTMSENLISGCLIVIFVVVLLLGNWRLGLVVASVIPLCLLFALSMMYIFRVDTNLMSLGAIDFGKTEVYFNKDQNSLAPNNVPLQVWGIQQSLEFPTVYAQRKKLRDSEMKLTEGVLLNTKIRLECEISQKSHQYQILAEKNIDLCTDRQYLPPFFGFFKS